VPQSLAVYWRSRRLEIGPTMFLGFCDTVPHRTMNTPEVVAREKALLDELARLSKQQSDALQTAVYMRMEPKMAAEYDIRAKRIGELCKLLGNYTSK
jgi:hypothetical protein